MKNVLLILFALLMLAGTITHIMMPAFYDPLVPSFISKSFANYAAIATEGGIFLLLVIPATRRIGALAFLLLMLAFLPLHVVDLFGKPPAMGTVPLAILRLVIQLIVIYAAWWLWRKLAK